MSAEILDLSGFEEITTTPPPTTSTSFLDIYDQGGRTLDECVKLADLNLAKKRGKMIIKASDVTSIDRKFLNDDFRLPLGEVVVIAGAGAVGKGQFACTYLSYLSQGKDIESGLQKFTPCNSLFISAEDKATDIRARLERSPVAPNYDKIFIIDKLLSYEMGLSVSDEDGFNRIENAIRETGSKLTIIDPLQAFTGRDIDLSRTNHIRDIMHRISALAERTDSVIVIFCHPNKRNQIVNLNDLVCGSADIVSAARSVLTILPDFENNDPETRLIIHSKANHSAPAKTLKFSIGKYRNQVLGLSDVSPADAVDAINTHKLSKGGRRTAPNYNQLFLAGCKDLLSKGIYQSSFQDFTAAYAPDFGGKPSCVFGDINATLEEQTGYFIQLLAGKSEVRIGGQRGFRLVLKQ